MKILLPSLLLLCSLLAPLALSSCASTSRLNEDGTYTAPPSLNTVDQTTQMQSSFRELRN